MQLFKNLIAKHDKPAAPPPSLAPRRTVTQEYMEHHGPKRSPDAGFFGRERRTNRVHPLGGQG